MNFVNFLRTPFHTEHHEWLLQDSLLTHKECQNLEIDDDKVLTKKTYYLLYLTATPGKATCVQLS